MKKVKNLLTNLFFYNISNLFQRGKKISTLSSFRSSKQFLMGKSLSDPQIEKTDCGATFSLARKVAFTLAEVLITIGVIGIVAALTLSVLTKKIQDFQFRMAYKKAYADVNQAIREPIANGEFTRTAHHDWGAGPQELRILKERLKVSKSCSREDLFKCWVDADRVCKAGCGYPPGFPNTSMSDSFIDSSGRAWAQFSYIENIFFVDVNGFKKPNRFGKDRFIFVFANKNGKRTNNGAEYAMMGIDHGQSHWDWCYQPPCYYKDWLK